MTLKLLSTTVAATLFAAGAAFAQTTSATGGKNAPEWVSQEEAAMYEENDFLADFFTDETMTEMRSEEEFRTAYEGLSQEDRDNLVAACQRAKDNRGSYGTVTLDMCTRVETM